MDCERKVSKSTSDKLVYGRAGEVPAPAPSLLSLVGVSGPAACYTLCRKKRILVLLLRLWGEGRREEELEGRRHLAVLL